MEADFRKLMVDNPAIAALVSTRVFPSHYEQGALSPAMRYHKVSGVLGLTFQGSDGLAESVMQVDVRAASAASAFAVRDALVTLLHGYRGIVGSTDFRLIRLDSDRGVAFEKPAAVEYYSTSLDFRIWSRPKTT